MTGFFTTYSCRGWGNLNREDQLVCRITTCASSHSGIRPLRLTSPRNGVGLRAFATLRWAHSSRWHGGGRSASCERRWTSFQPSSVQSLQVPGPCALPMQHPRRLLILHRGALPMLHHCAPAYDADLRPALSYWPAQCPCDTLAPLPMLPAFALPTLKVGTQPIMYARAQPMLDPVCTCMLKGGRRAFNAASYALSMTLLRLTHAACLCVAHPARLRPAMASLLRPSHATPLRSCPANAAPYTVPMLPCCA